MADEIKAGSVVKLKSGGPAMTVAWVETREKQYTEDVACCTWFIEDKGPWKLEQRTFPLTSLKLLQP